MNSIKLLKNIVFSIVILTCATNLGASVPQLINYQGILTDPSGNPLNSYLTMEFNLYSEATETTGLLWTEKQKVTVTEGRYSVLLGSIVNIPLEVFNGQDVFLGIKVGGDPEMTPRKQLVSVGYSFRAACADTAQFARVTASGSGGNTLDQAYDQGGKGAGHLIEVDAGPVVIVSEDLEESALLVYGNIGICAMDPSNALTVEGYGTEEGGIPGYPEVMARFKRTGDIGHSAISIDAPPEKDAALYLAENGRAMWGLRTDVSDGNRLKFRYQFGKRNVVVIDSMGFVSIGAHVAEAKLDVAGNIILRNPDTHAIIMELGEGLDYAEGFDISGQNAISPGSVLIIDSENPGQLTQSTEAYDSRVAGIVAGGQGLRSGVRLGAQQFDQQVALAGRVYCNVEASNEDIQPGDLLTTSNRPGYAMKATDYRKAQGAILGKAMQGLAKGKSGQILVLVTLQ